MHQRWGCRQQCRLLATCVCSHVTFRFFKVKIKYLCAQSVFMYLLSGSLISQFIFLWIVTGCWWFIIYITLNRIKNIRWVQRTLFFFMELHCREVFCFVYIWAATKNEVTRSYERNCNKIIISIVQMKYLFYKLSRRMRLHYNSRAKLSSYNLSNSSRKLIKQIFHLNNTYNT